MKRALRSIQTKFPHSLEVNSALERLVSRVLPAVVVVQGSETRSGAGVIWHPAGLVLTNLHVLDTAAPLISLADGRQLPARVLASEPDIDLALLWVPARGLETIRPAGRLPRVGELVFAFGHPWGQRGMVTSGVVSALISAETFRRRSLTLLRTDAPLAPGNSGGPLVTAEGVMVGINNMIVGGNQGVAIPIDMVKNFVKNFLDSAAGKAWARAAAIGAV